MRLHPLKNRHFQAKQKGLCPYESFVLNNIALRRIAIIYFVVLANVPYCTLLQEVSCWYEILPLPFLLERYIISSACASIS